MPSVTSMSCSDARSICEYDLHRGRPAPRRAAVDSLTSDSSVASATACSPPTPARARASARRARSATRSHHATSTPAAASGGASASRRSTPWRVEPGGQGLLPVGDGERVDGRVDGLDLAAQRVEGGELLGGDVAARRAGRATPAAPCRWPRARRRRGRGRGRVVDLVGEAGGERARARPAPRAAAPSPRCSGPSGRSPAIRWMPKGNQALRTARRARRPAPASIRPAAAAAAGGEVDAVLVPGPEAAGPAPGHVHRRDDGVLASDAADQLDPPVEQHPPEVGGLALAEQHVAGLEGHLVAAPAISSAELVVAQPVEEDDRPEVADLASDRRQVAVHEVDRHRALPDGGRDPLHRVEPDVAGGEHAGHARLERERRAGRAASAGAGRARAGPGP